MARRISIPVGMSVGALTYSLAMIGSAAFSSTTAFAQDQAPTVAPPSEPAQAPVQAPMQADDGGIEEIVVTAQRRNESAQSVPISLQSFSADSLDQQGISATEDLTAVVGGLVIQPTAARPAIFLRGVGTNSSNTTPAVQTFVDGVYHPFGQASDFENVERIEILKGPQGTLFGRNATGGVIQIITKPPSETTGGEFELGYGNYDTIDARGYITTGLTDGVAVDLAARYKNRGNGFGTNLATGQEWYTDQRFNIRGRIRAELSDVTTLTLSGDYSRIKQDLGDHFVPSFSYRTLFVDGALRELGGSYFPGDFDANSGAIAPYNKSREWGVSATLETTFGGLQARSITAYRQSSEKLNIDSDGGPNTQVHIIVNRDPRTSFTQELQLLSNPDSSLQWVVGAFYYHSKVIMDPFGFFGSAAPAFGGTFTAHARDFTDSIAGYAQATYEILPRTKLTLGGRYTVEKRKITGEVRRNDVVLPPRSGTLEQTAKEPTWRVALDHTFTPGMMVYASVSRAFNAGFFNQSSTGGFATDSGPTAQNPRVNPEFLTAYEIGAKADLFDRRLRLNVSAFKYDYDGLQQQVYELGATKTINAGSAEIKGVEVEITARPIPSLTLGLSATYLDAKYKSYLAAPNYTVQPNGAVAVDPVAPVLDAAGKSTTNTPEWSYTASATHVLTTSIGKFTTSANLNYRSSFFADPQNRFSLPSRYVLNLTERWTAPDEHFFVSVWAKNLLDERYDHAITIVAGSGLVGTRAEPRTFGVSAGFEF